MKIPPYEGTFGGIWESFRLRVGDTMMYCCRRPEEYTSWVNMGHPWGHVYVLNQDSRDPESGIDGKIIEHHCFMEVSPLELNSVIYAMHAKYSP